MFERRSHTMKKKVFATVLAGMMALSLTACGNADSTAPEENGSGTQTAAVQM